MSSKLARYVDHRAQHLCPSRKTLECSFLDGSKDEWADERQLDSKPPFFFRQALSKSLLHCLLAQQHQPSEHVCSGLQISSDKISKCATFHDGLSPWMGDGTALEYSNTLVQKYPFAPKACQCPPCLPPCRNIRTWCISHYHFRVTKVGKNLHIYKKFCNFVVEKWVRDCQTDKMPMHKGIAVFLETDKTDKRLTWFRLVLAVEMTNSLENLCRIQLICRKFSREFHARTADSVEWQL